MTRDLLIGLDAGTSMLKAVAFTPNGEQVACAGWRNQVDQRADGGVEQDPWRTWRDTAAVLRRLRDELPDLPDRVIGLAVTGQGDGTWLIDAAGEPVGQAWLWHDARAAGLVREIRDSGVGEQLFRITGTGLNPSNQSSQLLWMKRNRPEVLERAATAFHCKDWLYFRMTGERATDVAEGTFTFGDYRRRDYADEVFELLGIRDLRRLCPPMLDGTRRAGRLLPEAAEACGLPPGLPVVLAPVDILCTGLGAGLYDPEVSVGLTIVGSTGIHMRLFDDPDQIAPHNQAGYTIPFMAPGTWVGMTSNMAATLNIDWIVSLARELIAATGLKPPGDAELLALLDRRAGEQPPGALLYHPYICEAGERGPFVDARVRAQFLGLSTASGPFDMMRAVYEGLGFAARDCYAAMNHRPAELRLAGGAARSDTLRAILAAAVGAPARRSHQEEAGAAGAAMVAGVALGLHPDLAAACRHWVEPLLGEPEVAEAALADHYDRLFPLYREGYRRSFDLWAGLDTIRRGLQP